MRRMRSRTGVWIQKNSKFFSKAVSNRGVQCMMLMWFLPEEIPDAM